MKCKKKSFFYLNDTLPSNFHSGCVCVRARAIDVMVGLVCWRRKRNIRVVSLGCDFYSRNREQILITKLLPSPRPPTDLSLHLKKTAMYTVLLKNIEVRNVSQCR